VEQERWLARRRADADRLPLRPRLPLLWEGQVIGSVEAALPEVLGRSPGNQALPLWQGLHDGGTGYHVEGPLSPALALIAEALRAAQLAHVWRNELLPVRGADGGVLGVVERAVVRPLGIPTRAVHLVGRAPDGRHWVQQRSLSKANDPGLWDTLVGGMVPAGESVPQALARETWEEAGLRMEQLEALAPGGCVSLRRPTGDGRGTGYVVEDIDWFQCVLPDGLAPVNQDGEVARFCLLTTDELRGRLLQDEFTLEAALILAQALAWHAAA
jgi:8-oxo-dGTP pyrophosphatase MutT (NUDIX family)